MTYISVQYTFNFYPNFNVLCYSRRRPLSPILNKVFTFNHFSSFTKTRKMIEKRVVQKYIDKIRNLQDYDKYMFWKKKIKDEIDSEIKRIKPLPILIYNKKQRHKRWFSLLKNTQKKLSYEKFRFFTYKKLSKITKNQLRELSYERTIGI